MAGLLGLGFPANAETGKTPWFINAAPSLISPVFAFYLARNGASGSELAFGAVDSSKYSGCKFFYQLIRSGQRDTHCYLVNTSYQLLCP